MSFRSQVETDEHTCSYQLHVDEIPTGQREETMSGVRVTLDTNPEGYWKCPHESLDGSDLCLFHCPLEDRPEDLSATTEFVTVVQQTLSTYDRDERRQRKQFIGATFEALSIEDEVLDSSNNFPLDLRCATIEEFRADSSTVCSPIDLRNATIGELNATNAEWGRLFAQQAVIETAEFDQATLGRAYFDNTNIDLFRFYQTNLDYGNFHEARIKYANFLYGDFGEVGFFDAEIDVATFFGATFRGAYFNDANFVYLNAEFADGGEYQFKSVEAVGATFRGISASKVRFDDSTFDRFRLENADVETASANNAELGIATLDNSQFAKLGLTNIQFAGAMSLASVTIKHNLDLTPDVTIGEVGYISFRDASLGSGHLGQPDRRDVIYDFTDAVIGTVTVSNNSYGEIVDRLRFVRTGFDGFEFGKLQDFDLDAVEYALHTLPSSFRQVAERNHRMLETVADLHPAIETKVLSGSGKYNVVDFDAIDLNDASINTAEHALSAAERELDSQTVEEAASDALFGDNSSDLRTLEITYLKAKNGASSVGDSTAAGQFFQQERRYRRKRHWSAIFDRDRRVVHRIRRGSQWLRNSLLAATTGYGERPWRVVSASLLTVLGFSLIYFVIGEPLNGGQQGSLIDYFIFSFQSFITFIVGPPVETPALSVRIISAVEGFVGAFFVALFVFALTRQIHR